MNTLWKKMVLSNCYSFSLFLLLLICAGNSNAFDLKFSVLANNVETQPITFVYKRISGTPSCSIVVKDPMSSVIYQNTVLVDSPSKEDTAPASVIGSIGMDFVITSTVTCTEGSDTVTFTMKSNIHATETTSGTSSFPFKIEIQVSSAQASPVKVALRSDSGNRVCSLSLTNPSLASLSPSGSLTVGPIDAIVTVTKTGSSDVALIKTSCVEGGKTLLNDIPVYFAFGGDPWATISGDPHFKQPVLDKSTSKTEQICYDVIGLPNDYIHIAGYSENNLKIFGQLKDDYYLHRILVVSSLGNITATQTDITLDDKRKIDWNDKREAMVFETKFFKYQITDNLIYISTLKPSSVKIQIQKSENAFVKHHLDVSLQLSTKDYWKMNGLLGDIGKKEYVFYSEVQQEDSNGSKSISVGINNSNLIRGTLVRRGGDHCYLMNVDDILKPLNMSKYLFKIIN